MAQCLAEAERANPEVAAARADMLSREAAARGAGSGLLPRVDLESSTKDETVTNGSRDTKTRTRTLSPAAVNVGQLLFDFGRTWTAYRKAAHDAAAARHSLDAVRAQTAVAVRTAYIGVLRSQRTIDVAERTISQRENLLKATQELFDAGLRPKFDVLRAGIDLGTAKLTGIEARTRMRREWQNLAAFIGRTGLAPTPLEDILTERTWKIDAPRATTLARERRPELLAQREQSLSQERLLAGARREFLPSLDGSAALFRRQTSIDGTFLGHERGWSVGAALRWNLFSGFSSVSTLQKESRARDKALAELRQQELKVETDLTEALTAAERDGEQLAVNAKLLLLAEENESLTWEFYRSGKGTLIQVTDAQRELLTARLNHVNSMADYAVSMSRLERAVGVELKAFATPGP